MATDADVEGICYFIRTKQQEKADAAWLRIRDELRPNWLLEIVECWAHYGEVERAKDAVTYLEGTSLGTVVANTDAYARVCNLVAHAEETKRLGFPAYHMDTAMSDRWQPPEVDLPFDSWAVGAIVGEDAENYYIKVALPGEATVVLSSLIKKEDWHKHVPAIRGADLVRHPKIGRRFFLLRNSNDFYIVSHAAVVRRWLGSILVRVPSFLEKAVRGWFPRDTLQQAFDDEVDRWHNCSLTELTPSDGLCSWLGMTFGQYKDVVANPEALSSLVAGLRYARESKPRED